MFPPLLHEAVWETLSDSELLRSSRSFSSWPKPKLSRAIKRLQLALDDSRLLRLSAGRYALYVGGKRAHAGRK